MLAGAGAYSAPRCETWRVFADKHLKLAAPFASHHEIAWEWGESVQPDNFVNPLVLCWPRGGGKSTTIQGILARMKERGARKFGMYVSGTQKQANEHLADVGKAFESMGIERLMSQYGYSKGWNATVLRCSDGFSVVAVGLDAAARGFKIEGERPGFIILDDIDELHDSDLTVTKKIETITQSILPTMSPNGCVAYVQNVVNAKGIMASFIESTNDFLLGATVIGPIKACELLTYERDGEQSTGAPRYKVTGGIPCWEGQNLRVIENQINNWGLRAFLRESQHEVFENVLGALWSRETIDSCRVTEHPKLKYIAVGFDPAVTADPTRSDMTGIILLGLGIDNHMYLLRDYSGHYTPHEAAEIVYRLYGFGAQMIVVETNQGGMWVIDRLKSFDKNLPVQGVHVHQSKEVRAEDMSIWYKDGRCHHVLDVDEHGVIENGLLLSEKQKLFWVPDGRSPSPNCIDAETLAFTFMKPMADKSPKIIQRRAAPRRAQ